MMSDKDKIADLQEILFNSTKNFVSELKQKNIVEKKLQEQTQQLTEITSAMSEYLESENFDKIANELIQYIASIAKSSIAFLAVLDNEKLRVINEYSDLAKGNIVKHNIYDLSNKYNLFTKVINSKKIIFMNSLASDPYMASMLPISEPGINCYLGLPIVTNNKILGMVGMLSETGKYDLHTINNISVVVKTLGVLFSNYRKGILKERYAVDLESAKLAAEKANAIKTEFLSNISHELRTPLTSIIGYADNLVSNDYDDIEKLKSFGDIIARSGRHLLQIINDILDLSKVEAGQVEIEKMDFSILDLLEELQISMRQLSQDKNINFTTKIQYPFPRRIKSDPTRLRQILLNLYNNAVKFTDKGSVNVDASFDVHSNTLIIKISDTGCGISKENLKKIFSPFIQENATVTRRYGGTGLGLAICKNLVEKLNGDITVKSKLGEGSQFVVALDLSQTPVKDFVSSRYQVQNEDKYINSSLKAPKLRGRVLLAEDSIDNRDLIKLILEQTGLEVITAVNGEEAVTCALENDLDLVLMDIQMPVLDGVSATKTLIAARFLQPIIALTANVLMVDKSSYVKQGFSGYLEKPINLKQLYSVLEKYLSKDSSNEYSLGSEQDIKPDMFNLEFDENFAKLKKQFFERLPVMYEEIIEYKSKSNWSALNRVVHVLKGVGSNFGCPELSLLSKQIGEAIAAKDYELVNKLLDKLYYAIANRIENDERYHNKNI